LFWPSSEARYIMPAVWPLSVMAALLVARHWNHAGMPTVLAATLFAFVAIQGVYVVREGETPKQISGRQMADAMANAFKGLPDGDILIWRGVRKANYNLYVYTGRNATLVSGDAPTCKADSSYLLADDDRAQLIDPKIWSKLTEIDGAHMALYQRQPGATGC
jgi:hypothetical protein